MLLYIRVKRKGKRVDDCSALWRLFCGPKFGMWWKKLVQKLGYFFVGCTCFALTLQFLLSIQ